MTPLNLSTKATHHYHDHLTTTVNTFLCSTCSCRYILGEVEDEGCRNPLQIGEFTLILMDNCRGALVPPGTCENPDDGTSSPFHILLLLRKIIAATTTIG